MDPLSITASLIAVLQISSTVISALYEYRKGVKSACKDAADIIGELNSLRIVLESLLIAIEKEELGLEGASRLSTFQQLAKPNGEIERCKADLMFLNAKLQPETGWKALRQALIWPLKEAEVKNTLENLQRAKSTLHFALAIDQAAVTLEIHDGIKSMTEQLAESRLDEHRSQIWRWLSAPDPSLNHSATRSKRQPLTGNWFLTSKEFEHWKASSGSFLWLYGIPGCGKSVLCSSIIEDLSDQCRSNMSLAIAFYYFDFNEIRKRDVDALTRALLAQLVIQCPSNAKCMEILYSQIQGGLKQREVNFLLGTLREFVQSFEKTYIVIDALDECSECEELMKFIELVHGWESAQLRILVTSRQLPEIEEIIRDHATGCICLQESKITQDITMLIHQRLDSDRKFQRWPLDVRAEIQDALIKGAGGMFRWVVCQLDMLRNCFTVNALREALSSLPKTLDETYERILTHIDESCVLYVQKVLQYLAFSKHPVSLLEMVEVLAVDWDGEKPQFDPQNRLLDPKDILTICSTLVTISETTGYRSGLEKSTTFPALRLAHFSVKEYIVSNYIKNSKASPYSVTLISANTFIARTYLGYLLNPEFETGHKDWSTTAQMLEAWPLLQAATELWPIHIKAIGDELDKVTKQLILKFFATQGKQNGGNYAFWVGWLIPDANLQTIRETPPLYYAASYGMTSVIKMLLETTPKRDVDARGGRAICTPLHVSCFRSQFEAVRLLLEAGADPTTKNNKGESCIFWARRGTSRVKPSEQIYDLLIQYGAKDTPVTTPFVKTAAEMLEDEHYSREYYRLSAKDKMDERNCASGIQSFRQ